ncbi:MAG: hypothetical protein E4H00_03480 [Myxococcales bacterium]|nr:MAG: hypothetical protein E4H00_03480 [Myxococcales bacterium]
MLDELLLHQGPRSLLFLADDDHLDSIVDAVASQHEIRVFAGASNTTGLVEHIENLLYPRVQHRHRLRDVFLEVHLPDGHASMLPIADVSNRGCAVYLRSDQTYYVPCVPGAVLSSSRIVSRGTVIMDQIDATVRYVDAVERHSELHDARLGLEFVKRTPLPDAETQPEERISDPVQVFALIKEGLKKKRRSGVLEVLDSQRQATVMCSHLNFDARHVRLASMDEIECEQGDVVRVSFELGGARYAFVSSVMAAIPSEPVPELLIRLPRGLVRTRQRAHHRLKPVAGQVTVTASSPFGTGEVESDALDLTSSGVSFRIDGTRDLFPIGTLIDPLTLGFASGDSFPLVGRVRSLTELPDGSWKCGVELKDVSPQTAITLADRIVDATRPKVMDGIGTRFDDLWALMKDSGFIYPEKRRLLDKESVHRTFDVLLGETNPVMKTLVSRQDGELLGHLSAMRAYSKTWEIQHLATKTTGNAMVLGRHLYMAIVEYLDQRDDSIWIRSLFQPSNRWANRIFGRYERRFTDPGRKEAFIYDYVAVDNRGCGAPEEDLGIDIRPMRGADLRTVEQLFLTTGRAISLQALDLNPHELSLASVDRVYKSLSLERRREAIVAEAQGRIRGFAFLEFSSAGLNLSEVTNSFSPYVLDPRDHDAIQALGYAARKRYSELGHHFTIGLVEPNTTPALEMIGYSQLRRYLCITAHRDLYRRLHDYLAGRFR